MATLQQIDQSISDIQSRIRGLESLEFRLESENNLLDTLKRRVSMLRISRKLTINTVDGAGNDHVGRQVSGVKWKP